MIENPDIIGALHVDDGSVQFEALNDVEQTVWELEVAYLEAREPGFREALERFVLDGSSDATDPIGDAGKGLIR